MKKTVGVLSLIVMLLSQVFSPFAYAVTGEETVIEESVVEIVEEPEVVEKGSSNETKDPENPVEEENIIVNQEQMSGDNLSGTNTEILSGGTVHEEATEENLEGKEDTDVIIENSMVVEAIEKGFGGEVEYNSEEVRGTKEHKNVKVEVYAETGAFEETPTLVIEPLESEKETEIKKVILDYNEDTENLAEEEIEQVAEEKITEVVAFDIKFLDKEEKEVQPREGMVKVEFNYTENETLQETEEHEVKVYHLDDKDSVGNTIEEIKDMKIDEPEVTENKQLEEQEVEEGTGEQKLTVIGDKFSIYTIVEQVKEEQLINFEYGMISIVNPYNSNQGITIMDRNLGATTTGAWKEAPSTSFGYHYQWGNNYGFDSAKSANDIKRLYNSKINVSGFDEYYGSTFVCDSQWMTPVKPLWTEGTQGPCPIGWHIPSKSEWGNLKSYYDYKYGSSVEGFYRYFNIPFAGYRDTNGVVSEVGRRTELRSSTIYKYSSSSTYSNSAFLAGGYDYIFQTDGTRSDGFGASIRCFKDQYEGLLSNSHTVSYYYGGFYGSVVQVEVKHGGKIAVPQVPEIDHRIFLGWYLTGADNEFDFTGTSITQDIELYIKWGCENGYDSIDGDCLRADNGKYTTLLDGKEFNFRIKKLANSSISSYSDSDTLIRKIKSAKELTTEFVTGIVSTDNSLYPVYAWFDNGTIFYYTEAGTIYVNEDASYMFLNLTNLISADLNGFKTNYVTDMQYMFNGCSSLTSLDVSKFDTSNVTNMKYMFNGCSSLSSLDVSKFVTSRVTDMQYMFKGCSRLTSLDVGKFDTSNVTNMSYMFDGCSSLTELDVSKFDTSRVSDMKYMFNGCSNLTSLDVSKFVTSRVTDMQYMFKGCSRLTSLDVGKFDTSNVTNMSYMFDGCSSLTELDVSKFDTSRVSDMKYMFNGCSNLTSLDVSKFDTSSATDMKYMFYGCSKLTSLDVSKFDTSSVTDMQYMFNGCSSLTELDVSKFDTRNVTNMGYMFNGCSNLTSLDVSKFDTSSVMYMHYMFYGCSSLTSLDLSKFNTSSVTEMQYMFYGCSNLISLNVSKFDTRNVTNMKYMFNGCSSLTSLDLSKFDTSSVTDMSYMFKGCSSLTRLDLSKFDTSSVTDMNYMFDGCNSLTSLDVSKFDTSSVTNMGYMFNGCSSLTSLDVSKFDTSRVNYMRYMFKGCSSLTSLDLSNFDTRLVTYMEYMFNGCTSLTTIYGGGKFIVRGASTSSMFNGDTNLVGGNGTIYNQSKVDGSYAKLDTENQSGYFTATGSYVPIVTAYLVGGDSFNAKIKSLAAGSTIYSYNQPDTLITGFKKAESIPDGVVTGLISNYNSEVPVYARFSDGIIYYYTTGDVIEMNRYSNYMFANLNSLKTIDMTNFDSSSVTNMYYMFQNCTSLESIDLSGMNMKNVQYTYNMFDGCTNLKNVDLSNRDVRNISSGNSMFRGCVNLTNLKIDGWKFGNNKGFYGVLEQCPLKKLSAKGWVLPGDFSERLNSMFYNSTLEEIDVSNWDLSKTVTIKRLFSNTPLKKIVGIKTWIGTDKKLKDMSRMFEDSYNFEEIDMSDMNFSKVTTIYEIFMGSTVANKSSKLKKINMNNVRFDSLENMAYFCQYCYNLEEVNLNNWNVNITGSDRYATNSLFQDAFNLKKLSMNNFGKIRSTYGMFENNYSLSGLDLSGLDTSKVTDMRKMFKGMIGITELDLSKMDTNKAQKMDGMFNNASNLKTIYVEDKFNTNNVTSSTDMFSGSISLIGGNGTRYDPNHIDVEYARVDNEYQSGYFTDPNHFAVRFITTTGYEISKQWISTGTIMGELDDTHRNYRYYTSGDLQTGFDFTQPLYGYTEIYVTWDDVHYLTYEYGSGVEEGIITSGSCVEENGEDRTNRKTGCEIVLPQLDVLTGYHTPLWYKKGEDITYPNLVIVLTGDEILEAKAIPNNYTVVFKPGTGTGEMDSQEIEYDKEENLNKNKFIKNGYHFSGWIDALGKEYRDGEKVINLLTEGILELTAQWLQNPPAAGGGKSVTPTIKEQEHNAAEEQKQEEKETLDTTEKEIQVEQVPTTNTSTQTTQSSTMKELTEEEKEIQSAYEWAYERDVTTIPSLDDAMPDGVVTRGHLAKMVVNYATNVLGREIPEKIPSECRWNDWRKDWESEEIKDYAVKSCALGLMGLDMPKFLPNMEVTRAQFGTIMSRLLWGKKYAGGTPYYRKHLNALKENNIMTQIENPEKRVELRQWVWLMLMRSAENK